MMLFKITYIHYPINHHQLEDKETMLLKKAVFGLENEHGVSFTLEHFFSLTTPETLKDKKEETITGSDIVYHENYKLSYKTYRKMPEITSLQLQLIDDIKHKNISYHDLPEEHKLVISHYTTYMEGDIYEEKQLHISNNDLFYIFSQLKNYYIHHKIYLGWSIFLDIPEKLTQQLATINEKQDGFIEENYITRQHNHQQVCELHILKLLEKIIVQYAYQEKYKLNNG